MNVLGNSQIALGQPKSLYEMTVNAVVWISRRIMPEINLFPANIYFDVLYAVSKL